MQLTVLTQSCLSTYRRCPRQYYYRYELCLARERTAQPLRFGSAYHMGLELAATVPVADAIQQAAASYDVTPPWADAFEWAAERETLRAMLAGYFWYYESDDAEIVSTEGQWHVPLVNPESQTASRTYALAGKIDKIIRLSDGRLAVREYKTTSESIEPDSEYWQRLRCDAQISAYVYAARKLGHDVETVSYDVTRKPEISPKLIPALDVDGCKIVTDANGVRVLNKNGKPRESASSENGWKLESARETAEAFGQRLLADIGARPEFYYARREIPRLQSDLDEFEEEVFQQSQQLHQSRRRGLWFRNVGPMTCRYCTFASFCLQNIKINDAPPPGFVVLPDAHPELTGETI